MSFTSVDAPVDAPLDGPLHAVWGMLHALVHEVLPAGSAAWEGVVWVALAGCLVFAVVAMQYALKPWAEKAMLAALGGATLASLLLYLSLQHSPDFMGEGALWKFARMAQYLPWVVISLGSLYLLYRGACGLQRWCQRR